MSVWSSPLNCAIPLLPPTRTSGHSSRDHAPFFFEQIEPTHPTDLVGEKETKVFPILQLHELLGPSGRYAYSQTASTTVKFQARIKATLRIDVLNPLSWV